MPKILITRPEHDPLTRHLSYWSELIINVARKKGFEVVDLHREKANQKEFAGRVKKLDPALVLLNGHGNEKQIAGHDNDVLVSEGNNDKLLKQRITYAVACESAKSLGNACADNETTFIGYNEAFIINLDAHCLKNPLSDKRAEKFLEPSNRVAISLIKGHTCQEAHENSQQAFKNNIKSLLAGANDPDVLDDIKDLYWNMTHQVCLGNGQARFIK
jgi:hypothetical protein